MTHESVVLLGTSRRERLTQLLQRALEEWRQQWSGGSHSAWEVDVAEALCRRPTMTAGRALAFSAHLGDQRLLAITVPMDAQHELLGVAAPSTVVEEGSESASAVVSEALQALCSQLARAGATDVNVTSVPGGTLSPMWAQYGLTVRVKTAGERVLLRARLFPALLQAMLPAQAVKPTEPLVSRRSAIGIETVPVQVWLGQAEVSLSELASLQVGNVILLDANVSGAGHLALPDGRELAQIRLGSAAGMRAVSVVGKAAGTPSRSL